MPDPAREMPVRSPNVPVIKIADVEQNSRRESNLPVVLVAIAGGFVLVIGLAVAVTFMTRDTWAEDNRYEIPRRVDRAATMDIATAAAEYRAILAEAEGHKLTRTEVSTALEVARTRLAEADAVIAEQSRFQAEVERAAARQRAEALAAQQEAIKKEREIQEFAERVRGLAERYVQAPQEVRTIVDSMTRLVAYTEAGIRPTEYSDTLRATLAEFRIYESTSVANQYPAVTFFVERALRGFKAAGNEWDQMVTKGKTAEREQAIQIHWAAAGAYVGYAKGLLDPAKAETSMLVYIRELSAAAGYADESSR